MPLVLADRVNETTTTTSTGTITLAGAVSGYQSFAVIGNGNTTYYTIVHQTANEWEVGIGTYTSSGTLLSRDTVLASSNSGSLVNFSAGTKFVFCDYPAGRAVYLDTATNVTIPGLTLSSGNLAFTSTAQRITADMSNGTVSNRFAFQNSVTNAQSIVSILPNGTGTVSQLQLFNNSTPTNAPFAGLFAGASDARIVSGVQGSGSYLPLTFYTNGSEQMRLNTSGNLGIGTASPAFKLQVSGTQSIGFSVNGTYSGPSILSSGSNNLFIQPNSQYTTFGGNGVSFAATVAVRAISGAAGFSVEDSTASNSWLFVNSSGNVGIGTASPGAKLDVNGTIYSRTGGVYTDTLTAYSGSSLSVNAGSSNFNVVVNGSERMRLDSAGRFLLGASSNTSRGGANTTALFYKASGTQYLDIQTGTSGDSGLLFSATSSSTYGLINYSNSVNAMLFYANSAERMRIDSSGNLGLGTSSVLGKMSVQTAAASSFSVRDSQPVIGVTGVLLENWNSPAAVSTVPFAIRAADFRFGTDSGGSFIERLRIDTSGNVGINTSSPSSFGKVAIQVEGTTTPTSGANVGPSSINLFAATNGSSTNGTTGIFGWNAAAAGIGSGIGFSRESSADWGTQIRFYTHPTTTTNIGDITERMRLNSSGNLGIGTTSPSNAQLVVTAASAFTANTYFAARLQAANYADTGGYTTMLGFGVEPAAWSKGAIGYTRTGSYDTGHLAFYVNSTIDSSMVALADERARITATGLGISQGNNPTQALSLYRSGSTNAIMSAGNSNTGLNGTLFGVDTAGNGIINQTQVLPLIFSTSNTERMRLTSAGRLGIATTIPEVDLQIGADTSTTRALSVRYSSVPLYLSGGFDGTNALSTFSTNAYANATGSGQSWTSFSNTGYGASAIQLASFTTGADIRFLTAAAANTNPTERARISAAGQLFVGGTTNSYNSALHLYNVNGGTSGSVLESYVTGTTSAYHAIYLNANGAVGSISTSGTATAFNTSSDYRLKDNIAPADSAGAVIDAIEVVKHDWKVGGHTRYGMIAQDLHMVAPEAVSVGDADDVEDFKNPWGVDYSKLVPMLVKEVQSLRARLAAAGL